MKKQIFVFALMAGFIAFVFSCKEIGPDINLHGNANSVSDTTYIESPVASPEAKNVLIEEFTGVQCPNCPAGHAIEASIEASYPQGRIAGVALHPDNSLGQPYPFSTQNLINTFSTNIYIYLGNLGSEPCAAIDRTAFTGQTSLEMDRSYWAGFAAQDLALSPMVNLELSDMYNPTTRIVTVIAQIHYNTAYTGNGSQPNNISIELTEDSIITAQQNGSVIDTNYVHNNVLRTMLTAATGDNVAYNPSVTLTQGRVVQLVYQDSVSAQWNTKNMSIIAFVHETANSQVVYQARKISLIN